MTFQINGETLIGHIAIRATTSLATMHGFNPATGKRLNPAYGPTTLADLNRACLLAEQAFDTYRAVPLEQRAAFLEHIAQNIIDLGPQLIDRVMQETGLPQVRLEGERSRTVNEMRLFAKVVRDGRFLSAAIDSALPTRTPTPRPDLRLRKIGLGPVAVFGASNFPLAMSVAGNDTASALAAGCPVVVKAHGAHPGTSELIGKAIQAAVKSCGLPEGVFSMVYGEGNEIGMALVKHPAIKAVGFTGSRIGGLTLLRTAALRPEPIPVYAEMSSINPMFLFDGALAQNGAQIAAGFVDSLTLGSGQFCVNPGLVIAQEGAALDRFLVAAASAMQDKVGGSMLTPGIQAAYNKGIAKLEACAGVRMVARGKEGTAACAGTPVLFATDAATFLANPELQEENFGASALVIACNSADQFKAMASHLEGQLTATLFVTEVDRDMALSLLPVLERKVGRILANGYPTGVEVVHAMTHGGPFPATSDSRTTSVGAAAIDRFLRPVSYQDLPTYLLPLELQDDNPLHLFRIKNGELLQS